MLKRDTQTGVQPSYNQSDSGYNKKRESSFRLRKQSKSPATSAADNDENESGKFSLFYSVEHIHIYSFFNT